MMDMENAYLPLATLLIVLSLSSLIIHAPSALSETPASSQPKNYNIGEIVDNVVAHVKRLSSFKSRVTGYPDFYSSAEYINKTFHDYGLAVEIQEYSVLVPRDHGTYVEILSPISERERIEAFTLWPNFVQTCKTPPQGISGKLIYVLDGHLEDFEGKNVNGSIVLMDFNSMDNWINAAKLGAEAVIFVEPATTDRYQALSKFQLTPIYFPRLYVGTEDGSRLMDLAKRAAEVRITSNITYETVKAWNIMGMVNGTEYPNDIMIISSHYDSWSVVPTISHGLDETVGMASLLELARYFAENPPKRTLWFLALSGHWQALAGAREFTEKYLFSPQVQAAKRRIWMQINLDLSADDKSVDLLYVGNLYRYGVTQGPTVSNRYDWILQKIYREYLPREIIELVNNVGLDQPSYWWGTQFDGFYILDSEPLATTGLPAFTIRTSYSYRIHWGTPLNFTSIDSDNLESQLEASLLIVQGFSNEEAWGLSWEGIAPKRMEVVGVSKGFATFQGKISSYNISVGWYSEVPHALVRVYIGPSMSSGGAVGRVNPFINILTYSDASGKFSVHGLPPSTSLPTGWDTNIDAWVVNKTDGCIEFAPDQGQYGWLSFPPAVKVLKHPTEATAVVMKSVSVTIYDVIDVTTIRRFRIPDLRNEGSFFNEPRVMIIPYDAYTRSTLIFYGTYLIPQESVAMVFVKPNERFTILLRGGLVSSYHVGFLVNADGERPEGRGYVVKNKRLELLFTAYEFAKDITLVSTSRYQTLERQFVRSLSADYVLKGARKHLGMSETFFNNKLYSEAYQEALLAWALALRSYSSETMPLIGDLSMVTLIFFAFLIPFVFFLERLVFHLEGKVRLGINIALATLLLISFYFVHPALILMTNATIGLLGVLLTIFFIITLYIMLDQTSGIMDETAVRYLGLHRAPTGRTGTLMISFSMALETMKRRRLRSILMFVTIIAISFALTSLSSVSYWTILRSVDRPWKAAYDGLLLKRGDSVPPYDILDTELEPHVRRIVEDKVGDKALVFLRVYLYPEAVYPLGTYTSIQGKNDSSIVKGILGLSPDETEQFEGVLQGRPFNDYDYWACIVPDSMSRILGVKAGDYADWHGIKLLVVGVIADELLTNYRDLDDSLITPIDPRTEVQINILPISGAAAQIRPRPQSAGVTLIVPVRLALALGGYVSSISVKFDESVNGDNIISAAKDIALSVDVGVYAGCRGSVKQIMRTRTFAALGLSESITVLLILGGANICSVMLGSIKERARDIFTFSSLGLSPSGIAFLFLTESMIYSVVGVMIGYLTGLVGNSIFSTLSLLPSNFVLNFSSLFVMVAISIIVLSCFASSLYPISIAAKLVTPSLRRKWEVKTKPHGDQWTVPLPFALTTKEEAYGCLEYLREYFERNPTESFRTRQVSTVSLDEKKVELIVAIPPYEMNVTQEVQLLVVEMEQRFQFTILLRKLTGPRSLWRSSNYGFIDVVRKQLLLWRSLPEKEREKYVRRITENLR